MNGNAIPQVFPWIGREELDEVTKVFEENWLTEGPRTKAFSNGLNALIGTEYGVFAPNGTLALFLGLLALDVGPGDEVIVPDCTFIGSANAVILTGATPVFVDVNPRNFQIDLTDAAHLVTSRTKAIMPVHLFGMSANMDMVMAFAARHGLKVIEDAAQGIGVKYRGRHVGTFGDVACFSFFADKTITTGEGGYVVAHDQALYKRLMYLRNQGRLERGSFIHPAIGYNFRMTDIQAAVGVVQLRKLPAIIERKIGNYDLYRAELEGVNGITFLELEEGSTFVPFRVVVLVDDAHRLMKQLEERHVQARSFFYPMHKQPCFGALNGDNGTPTRYPDSQFPNAIHGYEHGLCLPIFPSLEKDQIRYICGIIREFLHG